MLRLRSASVCFWDLLIVYNYNTFLVYIMVCSLLVLSIVEMSAAEMSITLSFETCMLRLRSAIVCF